MTRCQDTVYSLCAKVGQLILREIIKIVATAHMLDVKAKTHQIQFRLGSTQTSLAEFKGFTSKGREGK